MADKIMAAKRPWTQKKLGREVKNFDEARWDALSRDVVKQGNVAKVCVTNYK